MKVVDNIVQEMGCGEQCEVTLTSDYTFTDLEKTFLKIDDACFHKILFNIYLQDVKKLAEFWQMSESEKFIVADVMKYRGNKLLNWLLFFSLYSVNKWIRVLRLQSDICYQTLTTYYLNKQKWFLFSICWTL
ncbi:unnamed protein product [Schistosoma guineensis]|nr:unnamed protein product [Schistosoma guineensis]